MTSEDSETDLDEEVDRKVNENTQLFLVNNIKKFPEVLQKSQLPSAKTKKNLSLKSICAVYQTNFGTPLSIKQLLKKINNMKSRLKKKLTKPKLATNVLTLKPGRRFYLI